MSLRFSVAPWSGLLKITSALGTVLILAAGVAAFRVIPTPSGFTHAFGLEIALVFPVILVISLLFVVTGYSVDEHNLNIRRLIFSTHIPMDGLSEIRFEPEVCKGAIRLFGNGGLYSFTGLYQNKKIGRFRLFGTDLRRAVVLVLPKGVVVVTPATPHAFVEYLKQHFPAANRVQQESVV